MGGSEEPPVPEALRRPGGAGPSPCGGPLESIRAPHVNQGHLPSADLAEAGGVSGESRKRRG